MFLDDVLDHFQHFTKMVWEVTLLYQNEIVLDVSDNFQHFIEKLPLGVALPAQIKKDISLFLDVSDNFQHLKSRGSPHNKTGTPVFPKIRAISNLFHFPN